MTKNKKEIAYSTNNSFEAEQIKMQLELNGIAAFIMNKMDYAYQFGDIEILVDGTDIIKAKRLIQDYINNG